MWTTQTKVLQDIQEEIQELRTSIEWVGDRLIDVQKQVILKCDWNSTQFCVTPVHFNHSAYNWEQIKFHLQNIHYNASLNIQLLQKEIFQIFSKNLTSPISLETLAEQLADQLSGLDPRGWFQSLSHWVWNHNLGDCLSNYIGCLLLLHAKIVRTTNSDGQNSSYKYNK